MTLLKREPRAVYKVFDAAEHLAEPDLVHLDPDLAMPSPDLAMPSPGLARVPDRSDDGGRARFAVFALLGITVLAVSVVVAVTIAGEPRSSKGRPLSRSYAAARGRVSGAAARGRVSGAAARGRVSGAAARGRVSGAAPDSNSTIRPRRASRARLRGGPPRTHSAHPSARSPARAAVQLEAAPVREPVEPVREPVETETETETATAQAPQPVERTCPCGAVAEFGIER